MPVKTADIVILSGRDICGERLALYLEEHMELTAALWRGEEPAPGGKILFAEEEDRERALELADSFSYIILFTETNEEREGKVRPVKRYGCAEWLGMYVRELLTDQKGSSSADCRGIYSLFRGEEAAAFARVMGQTMAQRERTLLICLDAYAKSFWEGEADCTWSVSQFLFLSGRVSFFKEEDVRIYRAGDLWILTPPKVPEDIWEASGEEIKELINQAVSLTGCRQVLLDMGQTANPAAFLPFCKGILMPEPADSWERCRQTGFEIWMKERGMGKKPVFFFPDFKLAGCAQAEEWERFSWGPAGEWAKKLMKEWEEGGMYGKDEGRGGRVEEEGNGRAAAGGGAKTGPEQKSDGR